MDPLSRFEIITIIITLVIAAVGFAGWIALRFLDAHKALAEEKKNHAKQLNITKEDLRREIDIQRQNVRVAENSRIVDEIKRLVNAITELFADTRFLRDEIGELKRLEAVRENTCGLRLERLDRIESTQKTSIHKYDRALLDRTGEIHRQDRTDRES
jgi:hypothetical protein